MPSVQSPANPGLEPFDISRYRGMKGKNLFLEDPALLRAVARHTMSYSPEHRRAVKENLEGYGALVGGILNDLTEASHKEGRYGEIVHYDRTCNRIDEIKYCFEQNEARRISYEYGIVNLDFHPDWKFPFTDFHRGALTYLVNLNGEGGVSCPLAMTEGMIRVLKAIGTEEQKRKVLPLVAGPESSSYFMAGQYVTERVGGSNVGANRTVAEKRSDGKWILNGEKWFCSNPGDLWVTTAKVKGTNTVGLFLVPRIKDNGEINGCYLLRKKDIIGSRGKVTAEAVYENLEAEELGRPAHGIANLIKYVIKTSRMHVGLGASGNAERALMEALEYCRVREAYGRKIGQFASVSRNLGEMQILQFALVLSVFKNIVMNEEGRPSEQIVTPLLKYIASTHATWLTRESILLHGGNGILGDFTIVPRLHNDSIINETWEGTHNIIADHVLKAFFRNKAHDDWKKAVDENIAGAGAKSAKALKTLGDLRNRLEEMRSMPDTWIETSALTICDTIYNIFALSVLIYETTHDGPEMPTPEAGIAAYADGFAEIAMRGKMSAIWPDGVFAESGKFFPV